MSLNFDLARDSEEDKLYLVRDWKQSFSEEDKVDVASKFSEFGHHKVWMTQSLGDSESDDSEPGLQ